jgi:putative resolvase
MNNFVSSELATIQLDISDFTLRRWANKGKIEYIKTPGGHRRYKINEIIRPRIEPQLRKTVCYCRVSSPHQRKDLARQAEYLQNLYPGCQIIQDIGSGLNFKRKGLYKLVKLVFAGEVDEVIVAYRDRLCRFAFDFFEWLFSLFSTKIVVSNSMLNGSKSSEITEDLLAIIQVFSARLQGMRKYTKT